MELPREVISDLLPLYISGEVSPATSALVEAHLARDPELARAVAAARAFELPRASAAPPTTAKAVLDETRLLIKRRTDTLGLAIFFTLLPFTFTFDGSGITFLLIRDKPVVGAAWLFTAAMVWMWHVQIRRRLRVAGL
jgi:anti-sigma factor RsiW